jgi:REP element-mobilizing transposase RayT
VNELRFFNPYTEIRETANRLPHWQQTGAVYFVTFRLIDSIPRNLRDEWNQQRETWLRFHPRPWSADIEQEYHKRFSGAAERWLDAGYGECLLRQPGCAQMVDEAIRYFDGVRLDLISSVVMPNHIHALFIQNHEYLLEKLILSWKTFTARNINKLFGRTGSLWQRDYFDRLVRDETHFANCVRYIRRNPGLARLKEGEYILYESDTATSVE